MSFINKEQKIFPIAHLKYKTDVDKKYEVLKQNSTIYLYYLCKTRCKN